MESIYQDMKRAAELAEKHELPVRMVSVHIDGIYNRESFIAAVEKMKRAGMEVQVTVRNANESYRSVEFRAEVGGVAFIGWCYSSEMFDAPPPKPVTPTLHPEVAALMGRAHTPSMGVVEAEKAEKFGKECA